jgi:phospholipase/carboxylesterase
MSPATFPPPVVATHGATDPSAPLVVLLHGRGSNEQDILGLAGHLPVGPEYAAVRAPIAEGGGYAWFANRGIGRPVAESLAGTMSWFRQWLDGKASDSRPVIVVGFSGGAAFAGGLILSDPVRYAGGAILYGTLPFDAGVPVTASRLAHTPTFVAQGDADQVIPRELLDRTWTYLLTESGAPAEAHRDPGGHGITPATVHRLASWLHARLNYLAVNAGTPDADAAGAYWASLADGVLPPWSGPRPAVSWAIPQQQLSDNAPTAIQESLFARLAALHDVVSGPSQISVPGARGLTLREGHGPAAAFLVPEVREFAHLHPGHDGSLHLALPPRLAADVVAKGWGTPHPWAGSRLTTGFTLVFGPRDAAELDVVEGIVTASHAYAAGVRAPRATPAD